MVQGTLGRLLASITVSKGHEQALTLPFVLVILGTVGGAFTDVLILLHLALEGVSAKGLRSQQVGAQASILAAVVASTMMWGVAVASPLPHITASMPTGIEGVACVMVEAETLMHQNRGAWPVTLLGLMD